jgi:hypothetical protein
MIRTTFGELPDLPDFAAPPKPVERPPPKAVEPPAPAMGGSSPIGGVMRDKEGHEIYITDQEVIDDAPPPADISPLAFVIPGMAGNHSSFALPALPGMAGELAPTEDLGELPDAPMYEEEGPLGGESGVPLNLPSVQAPQAPVLNLPAKIEAGPSRPVGLPANVSTGRSAPSLSNVQPLRPAPGQINELPAGLTLGTPTASAAPTPVRRTSNPAPRPEIVLPTVETEADGCDLDAVNAAVVRAMDQEEAGPIDDTGPAAGLPDMPPYAPPGVPPAVFGETTITDPPDLGRIQTECPKCPAVDEFAVSETVWYDQSSSLQAFIERQAPFTQILMVGLEVREELVLRAPVYLKSDVTASIAGTIFCSAENIVIESVNIRGTVTVTAGFTRIMNCPVANPQGSGVTASQTGIAEVRGCEIVECLRPGARAHDGGVVSCVSTVIRGGRTYGILVDGPSAALVHGCQITENGTGIGASGEGSLHVTETEVTMNKAHAVEIASRGHCYIVHCAIRDHQQTGILVQPSGVVCVEGCLVAKCRASLIRVLDGGLAYTTGNAFEDGGTNPMLMAMGAGSIVSQSDSLSGPALAAIAAVSGGTVYATGDVIKDVSGLGAFAYEGGRVIVRDTQVSGTGKAGFEIRDGSVVELTDVAVVGCKGACVTVDCGTGFMRKCSFSEATNVGMELTNADAFEIAGCEFEKNKAGGLAIRDTSRAQVTNSKFAGNGQVGIDISGTGCAPAFFNCEVRGNGVMGMNIQDGACPKVVGGMVADQPRVGIAISSAKLDAENLEVSTCAQAAIRLSDGAECALKHCNVHDMRAFGGQMTGAGTKLVCVDSTFATFGTVAFMVVQDSALACQACKFTGSQNQHCEIKEGGNVVLECCDVSRAGKGIGLQVHSRGELILVRTKVHDEGKFGVMVGDQGVLQANGAELSENGASGCYAGQGCQVVLENCLLKRNGQCGMQCQGGAVKLVGCKVWNNPMYGIAVSPDCAFTETASHFLRNGRKNVYYG